MAIMRRMFGHRAEQTAECPYCGRSMAGAEIEAGLCATCSQRFARVVLAPRPTQQDDAGDGPLPTNDEVSADPIAADPPVSAAAHPQDDTAVEAATGPALVDDTRMEMLQRELDHTRELLAAATTERDRLARELDTARHQLDASADERSALLRLLNHVLTGQPDRDE